VRVALQMVDEGLISKEEAIFRVEPNQLYDYLVPRLDEKNAKVEVLATGLPASPGAAVGQIVFTADEAVEKAGHGAKKNPVILVRAETTPEDIHGMEVAAGILTSRGGMTSHAAVVTRGMGKCCVAGAGDIHVDEKKREMHAKGQTFKAGDWISLDGTTGRVIKGKLNSIPPKADDPELLKFMGWAEPFRTMKVRANADIPRDAIQARAFGAEHRPGAAVVRRLRHVGARLRRQWQATYPWLPGDLSDIRAQMGLDRYTVAGLNGRDCAGRKEHDDDNGT